MTQKRLVRYRLVDYADRLWYAEVSADGRALEARLLEPLAIRFRPLPPGPD